ncbi:MAG TPA: hypothetical protein VMG14_02550 [Thermoplasmata archaeon]|nr:hypothetical protein [Thermoplasmata archaeon]
MSHPAPPSPILGRLLEAAGYRLEPRTQAILAVRSVDRRAVLLARATRSPAEVESWFPADAIHRTIVYDDEPGETARAMAADRGIEIVSPSTLGPALGELLLPSPVDGTGDGSSVAETGPLSPPLTVVPEGERTVRPRIGRAEAETLAGVDGPRYTLRLVPFWVGAYRIRPTSAHGVPGPAVLRVVAVNAVSRRVEFWEDGDRELVDQIEGAHQRLDPQLGNGTATSIAADAIRRHHTVDVEHTEQHGGALVIETRRVLPAVDDFRLAALVLLYVPFWYVEGAEGRVVLDAVTGRRVSSADTGPA